MNDRDLTHLRQRAVLAGENRQRCDKEKGSAGHEGRDAQAHVRHGGEEIHGAQARVD